jgi:hippurate hydrolase
VTEFITNGQRNVLPGEAVLKGDFRALNPDDRLAIEKLMTQMANGICAAHGVTCQLNFRTEFIETINATTPTMAAVRVAENMGLDTIGNRKPMTFSEDFAHFNAAIPGCFFLLGNGVSGAHGQPLHSDDYDFNDELLGIGSKLWSALVRDRLPVDGDAIS